MDGRPLRYRSLAARKRGDVEQSARARGEAPHETLDRNVGELLQETRADTAGGQFRFAFLLTLPFTQRFGSLTDEQAVITFADKALLAGGLWFALPAARRTR